MYITKLQQTTNDINRKSAQRALKSPVADSEPHILKTGARTINVELVDYVLRATIEQNCDKNFQLRWNEPYQETGCHENYLLDIKQLHLDI